VSNIRITTIAKTVCIDADGLLNISDRQISDASV